MKAGESYANPFHSVPYIQFFPEMRGKGTVKEPIHSHGFMSELRDLCSQQNPSTFAGVPPPHHWVRSIPLLRPIRHTNESGSSGPHQTHPVIMVSQPLQSFCFLFHLQSSIHNRFPASPTICRFLRGVNLRKKIIIQR